MLELYEAIGRASARMREAAEAGDWDGLVAAESECAALVARLRARAGEVSLAPPEIERRNAILRQVLADDAAIRERVEPRLAELDRLVRGATARQRFEKRYRE